MYVYEVYVMRDQTYPPYPYLLVTLLIVTMAPLRQLGIYPVREPIRLSLYDVITDVSLDYLLIVP